GATYSTYLMPGFVDGHLHVESSMLPPPEFARLAMAHGTVAAVADPHEIGNVLGMDGVHYMIAAGERSPFKFYFGAPSCVPATPFETAGAQLDAASVDELLADPRIHFLSEVMNWPGVLGRDPEVMAKIGAAQKRGKLVDGHAPGLRGEDAKRYASAGITTDHETFSLEEALDKIAFGMRIGIREGSAAKNLHTLLPLLSSHADDCFFCTDDSHPDDLIHHHIDELVRRAIAADYNRMDVLRVACTNAVKHYGIDVGLLRVGDPADFIEVDNLD
ncbi:MAG: adenine deaminase, partial [bacterium]|nr:adenine deaminase [bacterium]